MDETQMYLSQNQLLELYSLSKILSSQAVSFKCIFSLIKVQLKLWNSSIRKSIILKKTGDGRSTN